MLKLKVRYQPTYKAYMFMFTISGSLQMNMSFLLRKCNTLPNGLLVRVTKFVNLSELTCKETYEREKGELYFFSSLIWSLTPAE